MPQAPPPGGTGWTPKNGVVFNNPFGTVTQQMAIITQLGNTIDSVPSGSKIRIAVYSWFLEDITNRILNARKRGVSVKVIVSDHALDSGEVIKLRKALGTNKKADNFITWCHGSCMSKKESMMHAKLYMFSTAGSAHLVSMVGSSNIASSATTGSWNNLATVTDNNTLYNANLRYFNDMLLNKSWKNYFRTAEEGQFKEYYYPRHNGNTMLGILNGVNCKAKPAPGYGYQGKTNVRVAMYAWTVGRASIARRLVQMRAQGCIVDVLYSGERVEQGIINILLKKTSKGPMPVWNGRLRKDIGTPYMHHKVVMINGVYFNNHANRAVYTGTANFTVNTETESNEIVIRIGNDDVYRQFNDNLNLIRNHHAKKVTKAKGAMHYTGDTRNRTSAEDDYMNMDD